VSILSFSDEATEQFFLSGRPRKRPGWLSVAKIVKRKLNMIHYAARIDDLKSPPGNRLEALRGDLAGWYRFELTTSGECCLGGRNAARTWFALQITTDLRREL
jgi:toxin HigB-1